MNDTHGLQCRCIDGHGEIRSVKRTRAVMLDGTEVETSRGVILRPVLRMEGKETEQIIVRTEPGAQRWVRYVLAEDGRTNVFGRGALES